MTEIIARDEARKRGLKRYFTGVSCVRGHVSPRLVSTGGCVECKRELERVRYHRNPDKYRREARKYQEKKREYHREYSKEWRKENKDKQLLYSKRYRDKNKDLLNKKNRQYIKNNRAKCNARNARRYYRIHCPKWADTRKIERMYEAAREIYNDYGVRMHVDHIIPISGDRVCGLHVHENLQLLPADVNIGKGNKWDDSYNELFPQGIAS